VNGNLTVKHIVGKTGAPSITLNSGAGTNATGSITGSDLAGIIIVKIGTSPATAPNNIATINYNTTLTSPGYPLITPANDVTAVLSGTKQPYITSSNSNNFAIRANATALSAGVEYKWYYHIMQ
jgi:hypothetical protein